MGYKSTDTQKGKTTWKAQEIESALSSSAINKDGILRSFPPLHSDHALEYNPLSVVDSDRNFVCFYLLGILTEKRSVSHLLSYLLQV